jgi:hypothetical protein
MFEPESAAAAAPPVEERAREVDGDASLLIFDYTRARIERENRQR